MTGKRATITDVARQAGVSKATVSAVINDSNSVKGSTRDRVLAAIDVLNYRPSQATHTGTRKTKSIGLLIKEVDNPYYAEVVLGARAHSRSPVLTMEVGAALAGQKPIYVLAEPDEADDLPSYRQRRHVLSLAELGHLAALLEEGVRPSSPAGSRGRSPRSQSSR